MSVVFQQCNQLLQSTHINRIIFFSTEFTRYTTKVNFNEAIYTHSCAYIYLTATVHFIASQPASQPSDQPLLTITTSYHFFFYLVFLLFQSSINYFAFASHRFIRIQSLSCQNGICNLKFTQNFLQKNRQVADSICVCIFDYLIRVHKFIIFPPILFATFSGKILWLFQKFYIFFCHSPSIFFWYF